MKVLVIGDAILDCYIYGQINRQSPEDASISVLDVEKKEYRLGGCMNVAANIRSISASEEPFEVYLSSIFSCFTRRMLYDRKIRCDLSDTIDETQGRDIEPCSRELIKTRIINSDTGKQLIRIDNRLRYSDQDIKFHKSFLGDIDDSFDAVVVSDYAKGLVNATVIEKLQKYKGPVFVDTKNPDLARWDDVPNCFIKTNLLEAQARTSNSKNPVITTWGYVGASLFTSKLEMFETTRVKNPNVVGAGDVFLAGLVVKFLRSQDIRKSIEFANMVAGKSVQQQGTTEVSL